MIALAAASIVLAVVMNRSILGGIATDLPQELRDPLLQSWQVAWGGDALLHNPSRFFHANAFYPLDNSLAFSDALIGYAPAGMIGSGPRATLVRYNLLFLFSYALAFAAAYLLARELGLDPLPAGLAAAAFAFAPWRLAQNRHLHVISSGGIPLSLFLLLRGYRGQNAKTIVAGWSAAAWQLSIGFTLGLQLAYLLAVLCVIGLVASVRDRWRKLRTKRVLVASAIGIVIFVGWAVVQALPYLEVVGDHPEARRSQGEVEFFSPPPRSFLAAPEESYVWAEETEPRRATLSFAQEQLLFPGITVLALGAVGAVVPVLRARARVGLILAIVATAVLSLGFAFEHGKFGYELVYDHLPGWQGIRTPGRITTLTTLSLGILAAAGMQWVARRIGTDGVWRAGADAVCVLFIALVLVEGAGRLDHPEAPRSPDGFGAIAGPALHLPTDDFVDAMYMFWSTDGFPKIANGVSGFPPARQQQLRAAAESFPDAGSIAILRAAGIRTVVLHRELVAGAPWDQVEARPVAGLPLTRTERNGMIVFEL